MILITDFLALLCVTVVALYLLWFSRKNSPPVYKVIKIMSVVIALLWITAAFLYSQQ
jgi:uncharacterized protein (DUF3820 family)